MFDKKHRYSFKKGIPKRIFHSSLFVLRYDTSKTGYLTCSVVVGKKVDKKAVVRNKVKRQLVSEIKKLVLASTPFSLVIYAKKPILDASKDELKDNLEKTFKSINILS